MIVNHDEGTARDATLDGPAQWVLDGGAHDAAAGGGDHRLHGAGAAVGQGEDIDARVRDGAAGAFGHRLGGLPGAEGALELLGRHQDPKAVAGAHGPYGSTGVGGRFPNILSQTP